ncbi:MAG: hypothetical protein LBU38_07920 [Propionibacteriaceae bacterium]|jgi:hypothetical protein|nr:hypothetical protein [Propionibacteriaceae bacterium]
MIVSDNINNRTCPRCGGKLILVGVPDDPTEIATVFEECPNCKWAGAAAGYVSPLLQDQSIYAVTIAKIGHPSAEMIRLVANDSEIGLMAAKLSLSSDDLVLSPRSAVETYRLCKKLITFHADFSITPEFDYLDC